MAQRVLYGRGVRQRGFTLIEIMIAVGIIGVLVALAIFSWGKSVRKGRGAEAQAFFAALRVAEEQYHLENGTYFSTASSEAVTHPATPIKTIQTLLPLPASWTQLRVQIPEQNAYCGYVVIAGAANDSTGIGAMANAFGFTSAPVSDWYYLLAHCDLDGSSTRDSYYFSWSGDTTVLKQNEGY